MEEQNIYAATFVNLTVKNPVKQKEDIKTHSFSKLLPLSFPIEYYWYSNNLFRKILIISQSEDSTLSILKLSKFLFPSNTRFFLKEVLEGFSHYIFCGKLFTKVIILVFFKSWVICSELITLRTSRYEKKTVGSISNVFRNYHSAVIYKSCCILLVVRDAIEFFKLFFSNPLYFHSSNEYYLEVLHIIRFFKNFNHSFTMPS